MYTEPGVMENEGYFAGVAYNFTYENRVLLSLDGQLAFGRVDYSSDISGAIDGKENLCADTRLLIGYGFSVNGKMAVTPYTGIAHRYLNDDGENQYTATGDWAYQRESSYIYSPIGLRLSAPLGNGWTFCPWAEYDFFWTGTQESGLGYQPGYENIENDQDGGYGFRAALGLERQSVSPFHFDFNWGRISGT